MIAVKGIYDGHVVRPVETFDAPVDTEVVLVVLDAGHAEGSGGDTMRFFGVLKDHPVFASDGVSLQKDLRRDWRD